MQYKRQDLIDLVFNILLENYAKGYAWAIKEAERQIGLTKEQTRKLLNEGELDG